MKQTKIIMDTANKLLLGKTTKQKKALIWLITEIIQIIILVMGAIMLLWIYTPYTPIAKIIITTIAVIIAYDVFKNFVYVRWILWKEAQQ